MTDRFLPYSRQLIDKKDIEEVSKVLKDTFLTQGPKISLFEKTLLMKIQLSFTINFGSLWAKPTEKNRGVTD